MTMMVLATAKTCWHCPVRLLQKPAQRKLSTSISSKRRPTEKVLVVGAGAIGLSTALELLKRNVSVVLEAPRHPLHRSTCSVGAGGLWMPFHVQDERVPRWAQETLDALYGLMAQQQQQQQQRNAGDDVNLVEIVPAVKLLRHHGGPEMNELYATQYAKGRGGTTTTTKLPEWTTDPRLDFQHLTVEMLSWQNIAYQLRLPPEQELKEAGYQHAWLFRPPVVNTPIMLQYLLQQIQTSDTADAKVNVETGHEYESIAEMRERAANLGCDTVVNATGLASTHICNDAEMVGARGIVLQFHRASCVRRLPVGQGPYGENMHDAVVLAEEPPWGNETTPAYLIPRGDTILIGGTYLEGDGEESIRDAERERLLQNAERFGIDVSASRLSGEWVGFRPFRSTVRCELDPTYVNTDVKVFHSYGYGGSGWTVNVGAARECVKVLVGL